VFVCDNPKIGRYISNDKIGLGKDMSGPEQFNAAAVTAPGLIDAFAAGYGVNFPSSDLLEKSSFKIVVGSWRRLNYASTTSSDFEVNVSDYAPKQCFVTRVQLVDVDIPNTQLLIEDIWNRVYFNLGCRVTVDCRTFNFNYTDLCTDRAVTHTVTLPLQLDAVRQYELLEYGYVRLYMQHRAPRPIVPLAHAWQSLQKIGYGCMQLIGLPGTGTILLEYNSVRDDTNMSFVLYSAAVWSQLKDLGDDRPSLYLTASILPGPSFLAKIISRAVSFDLNSSLLSPTCSPSDVMSWSFSVVYSEIRDTFDLQVRAPFPVRVSVDGAVADYMGFGSPYYLEVPDGLKIMLSGPKARFQQGNSFAAIQTGDPCRERELADWISAAFTAFIWPAFTFKIIFPGAAADVTVTTTAGYMSLEDLATDVQSAANTALDVSGYPHIKVSVCYTPFPGLLFGYDFASDPPPVALAFGLDFTLDETFDPSRIGYDRQVYPALIEHQPVRPARHVPQLPGICGPTCCSRVQYAVPQSIITVQFRPDCNQLVFEAEPYKPYTATLEYDAGVNLYTLNGGINANLFLGCEVLLAPSPDPPAETYYQVKAVVVEIDATNPLKNVIVALVNPEDSDVLPESDTTVTVIPQTVQPLVLFLQRSNTDAAALACSQGYSFPRQHGRTLDPEIIGFDALTYESCGKILPSPGTLEKWQDSYILLCLAFAAGSSPPVTGDVFYPLATENTIVFAKVLRGSVFLRADFDRMFDHHFAGSGQHLGYIRVKIMNPNGTPYQTHGHTCSITLKFDARSSSVAFGGGHVVVPGDSTVGMVPLSRGTMMLRNNYGEE
jgi:hypothetical protein